MPLYWILAFAFAWAITLPPAMAQLGFIAASPVPTGIGIAIGIAPLAAAAIVAYREGQARAYWRSLWRRPRPAGTVALALLLPPALLALAAAVRAAMGEPIQVSFDAGLAGFALLWLVLAFGEEAGWRGFALPRLVDRHGFWLGSLILGLIWCVWHYPKLLGSPYLGSFAEALPLIGLFSLQIVIANFILCWLYFRSGRSVLVPTLYHAGFNLVATAYFMAATDIVITAALAAIVLGIFLFDRNPQSGDEASD